MLPPSEFSNGSTARSAFHCSVASNAFSNCSQGHGSQFGYAVSAAASLYAPGMPWYATRMPFLRIDRLRRIGGGFRRARRRLRRAQGLAVLPRRAMRRVLERIGHDVTVAGRHGSGSGGATRARRDRRAPGFQRRASVSLQPRPRGPVPGASTPAARARRDQGDAWSQTPRRVCGEHRNPRGEKCAASVPAETASDTISVRHERLGGGEDLARGEAQRARRENS